MRILVALAVLATVAAPSLPAQAGVICVVDTPRHRPAATLTRPDGRALAVVDHGTEVEIVAMGVGVDAITPWAEIGPVGRAWDAYGWVVRRAVICGPR